MKEIQKDKIKKSDLIKTLNSLDAKGRDYLMRSINCGLEFSSCVAVGAFIGIWLDKKFNCMPLCLVIFLLFGCAAGYISMMKYIEKYTKSPKSQEKNTDVEFNSDKKAQSE